MTRRSTFSTSIIFIISILLLTVNVQKALAQTVSTNDIRETLNFQEGKAAYSLASANIPEGSSCVWKIDRKEVTDGISDNGKTITLMLSNKIRKAEIAITSADNTSQTLTFDIEPKEYGKDYNGLHFYADSYSTGDGSKDKPFLISNDMELAKLAHDVTNGNATNMYSNKYFKLTADIDLSRGYWTPIGTTAPTTGRFFAGKLDGDGHAIKNMHISWTYESGKESSWGLFSRLNGSAANETGFASVTNLTIDNACVEKKAGYTPKGTGTIKIGVIAGDMTQNAEISNIIIRESKVTDSGETYSTKNKYRVGGIVGYLDAFRIFRIFNISADTEMDMFQKANLTGTQGQVSISGGIGAASTLTLSNTNSYVVLPRNIYVHGSGIKTNADTNRCKKGSVIAFIAYNNFVDYVKDTWFYTPANKVENTYEYNKFGTEKDIDAVVDATTDKTNGNIFVDMANQYINDNRLDKKTWSYSNKRFSFSTITLQWKRGTEDKMTVMTGENKVSSDTYNWYVSRDNTIGEKANTQPCNPFSLTRQTYDQYVYAQTVDGILRTNSVFVPAIGITAKLDVKTKPGTYIIDVTNNTEEKLSNNALGLTITYEWFNGETKLSETSNELRRPATATHKDKFSCLVTVKSGSTVLLSQRLNATVVVYLCPAGVTVGDKTYTQGTDNYTDEEWGYTPDKPMLTWKGAYSKLSAAGTWNENIIVLMGESKAEVTNNKVNGFNITDNNTGTNILTIEKWDAIKNSPLFRNVTITGEYENHNYKGSIEITSLDIGLPLWGDTRFENITFKNTSTGNSAYKNIFCQYNNLEMGEGIKMEGFKENAINYGTIDGAVTTPVQIFGGFSNDGRFYPLSNKINIEAFEQSMPHGKEGFSITLKSGFYSVICVGGRQTATENKLNGVMGTPNLPIKCTITMDINRTWNDKNNEEKTIDNKIRKSDYDAGVILAGNHEGAMYADVDIIIKSGKVARVVNGTLGAQREFSFDYNGTTYNVPCNTFMGRANITLDPASSENNNDEDINSRVIITELYGGSTGRGHDGSVNINNPFYGYSTITINGGTFKVLPDDNNMNDKIFSGIYGAGAGGMNGIGTDKNHTPDDRIPYWNSENNVMLYGPYDVAKDKLIKYHCYNPEEQDYTDVDPLLTNTRIVINGGLFGYDTKKIDGIYAGGSGYMSKGLWTAKGAKPSKTGGNVYGKTGNTVVSLTINGGEFHCDKGIFAGGRGTDYYYSEESYGGTASEYKELGKTYGNVELNISGGTFYCPVFGGGYGVADAVEKSTSAVNTLDNMARIYGQSFVNITGGTFYKDIYGGGDMAVVEFDGDATNVVIGDNADIRGSVFAGGNGRKLRPTNVKYSKGDDYTQHPELVGLVKGNTNVNLSSSSQSSPYIYGDIFGGGNLAQVSNNTFVNIYAGNFAGQIFGGGNGDISNGTMTSADVLGNTNVTLAHDMASQEKSNDGKAKSNFSINVMWNKMWDADKKVFYIWDPDIKDESDEPATEEMIYDRSKFYDNDKDIFLNPHNIFGGGNLACKVGTYEDESGNASAGTGLATVLIQKGMTPYELLKTEEWVEAYTDNDNPHFSVFGGGYGTNTKVGSTDVTINIEGDYSKYDADINDDTEQLSKDHDSSLFDSDSEKSSSKGASSSANQSSTTIPVFDSSRGIPNFTIWAALGGGYSGTVTGNTKVTIDGDSFLHRVFGGGFGDQTSEEDNTTGQIGGNTEVYIQGANIHGDVFGGGAGLMPKPASSIYFVKVAAVNGTTKVDVSDNAKIYGNVYGGGDNANVGEYLETKPADYYSQASLSSVSTLDQTNGSFISYKAEGYRSFVNICGGNIYGAVFGGGKGLKKAEADQYYKVGRINGNTLVHIVNSIPGAEDSKDNIVPNVWNNIYGGCAYGTVDGNTLVHIEGGMLGNNIFGGGYGDVEITDENTTDEEVLGKKDDNDKATYANILGNTKVQIDGGAWIWNRKANTNGSITTWTDVEADSKHVCNSFEEFAKLAHAITTASSLNDIKDPTAKEAINRIRNDKSTKEFFDLEKRSFKRSYNIFGGGNRACYVGTYNTGNTPADNTGNAEVIINHSPLEDIKDTKGKTISMFDNTTVQNVCWVISRTDVSLPQFSVFGAGYGANTKVGKTEVYAQPGTKVDDNGIVTVDGIKYRYLNQDRDYKTYINFEEEIYNDYKKVSKEDKKLYYGSYDGTDNDPNTFLRYHISRIAWMPGLTGFTFQQIHGGGFAGYVTGGTYVETDCQLACHDIYGAGLGAKPYGNYTDGKGYDFGSVTGKSRVFIKSGKIADDVFGGGAGIESVYDKKGGKFIDFPNMAHVNGTEVHIYGKPIKHQKYNTLITRTMVMGNVYGGGDLANVGTTKAEPDSDYTRDNYTTKASTTLVNIRGGSVFSHVFAGGKGRLVTECADSKALGGIYGNTCLIIDRPVISYPYWDDTNKVYLTPNSDTSMAHPDEKTNTNVIPTLMGQLYGGCQNGTVYGNTFMAIYDGAYGHGIYGGGWGNCDTISADGKERIHITSADVIGNTNMLIMGGYAMLSSLWNMNTRSWEPASIIDGTTYSPQYNHSALKFKINHNIYAGGNEACEIGRNTYLTMIKGLLYNDTQVVSGRNDGKKLFESKEWEEIYYKVGSPHFSVFGGGYGENTNVKGDTYVNVSMEGRGSFHKGFDIVKGEEYKHFYSGYSVMDIIGGGYSGKVTGTTHIVGAGGVFCRRVFGGSTYSSVHSTDVEIKAIDCSDIFGGGFMGDVLKSTNVRIGTDTPSTSSTYGNDDIYIHGNVYGGNDVSGYVNIVSDSDDNFMDNGGTGTNVNILGGHIFGDVYGAGNGNYLYANDRSGNTKVTVNEYYPLNPNDSKSETAPLVYTVPMHRNMPSYKAASDAAKIVNINSWRPLTNRVNISIKGNSDKEGVKIDGDVYGGGNSATVQKVYGTGENSNKSVGDININIGSHVKIGRVFMGCNGDELFNTSEDNDFMNLFQKLNGDVEDYTKELDLADSIDWENDPSNKGISTNYLSTENDKRPLVYPHLIDLYFHSVETDIQGTITWNGSETGEGLTDCIIGSFCCGGNRGNMNVSPKTEADFSPTDTNRKVGNVLEYTFPEGLTITDKIIGGCNNANYDYKGKVTHEGGYLLGLAHSEYPFIKLNIRNKFQPAEKDGAYIGGNVYGGCYKSGTIKGDVTINLQSDMLAGKDKTKLEKSNEMLTKDPSYSALNVYGAGYGMESYIYGISNIIMGEGIKCSEPQMNGTDNNIFKPCGVADEGNNPDGMGVSANFIYGGGQQGNVIGVTNVDILNGHVFRAVTGGSYSGYVYGSTNVKVGYPIYYHVNSKNNVSGRYILNRTDKKNLNLEDYDGTEKSPTIKQHIYLLTDDFITQGTYENITAIDNGNGKRVEITDANRDYYFTKVSKTPSVGWEYVHINIDEAVYGGGYSIAQGSSVLANNTTVLKFTDKYNVDHAFTTSHEQITELSGLPNGTTAGFGGNTVILVGDNKDSEHITISHQDMQEVKLPENTDLFGYYYKHYDDLDKDEYTYRYISLQDKYFFKVGTTPPAGLSGIKDNVFYEYDSEGGIFGDGHLSYAQGFRSADVTGYGFAEHTIDNPKIINTFQRMDILRLEDNCFSLLGARDYTVNEINKTPYSIARVGEIKMVADNIKTDSNNSLEARTDNDTAFRYSAKARNYMGLSNNIHYVGAVTSNTHFNDKTNDPWHNRYGKLPADADEEDKSFVGMSYQEVKQKYIDDYHANKDKENADDPFGAFQKRNDGTAKNMIGIASGYAMKIQLCQEDYDTESKKVVEKEHYGPIYGVVEMNLINVREDEGGGYVYADNNHTRHSGKKEDEDFLETTGNFVFPYHKGRYIVDDCFPTGYYTITGQDSGLKVEDVKVHYWYVTGFHYYYNANITGYTYNSSKDNPLKFNSDNKDGLTVLAGLKSNQPVRIHSWKMRSGHPADKDKYSSDLEYRNYLTGTEENATDKKYYSDKVAGGYKLYVGGSESNTFSGATSDTDADKATKGFAALLSMKEDDNNENTVFNNTLPNGLKEDAKISFTLVDMVDNTNKVEPDYFNKHLAEKSMATLVLKAPAYERYVSETDNKPIYTNTGKFYKKTGENTYELVEPGSKLDADNTYYQPQSDEYVKIENLYTYDSTKKTYEKVNNISDITVNENNPTTYYVPREYTYTIYLTIEYVQGPTVSGHITVGNCALPGEMIRVTKDDIVVSADQSFAVSGYYWRIGKRVKDNEGKWEFKDTTPWTKENIKANVAKDYDTFNQADTKGTGLFDGCHYDTTNDYLDIPVYYYMNGYGIQLGLAITGMNDILQVDMRDDDKLVVHNYHRMDPHKAGINLHLADAIIRAKEEESQAASFPEPRIYLADGNDLNAFINFVDTIGTNSKAPRCGAYAQFILQNDLTVEASAKDGSYINNFAGTLHGNGHIINGIKSGNALFKSDALTGNIYNLGLSTGMISNMSGGYSGKPVANYHCCFEYAPTAPGNASTPVVYHWDGTPDISYSKDDFRYGRVAYDLNEYYLRARHRAAIDASATGADALTKADSEILKYVYDYYANGDYQYACRKDDITGNNTGITYLRTGKVVVDIPNYEDANTRHDKTHPLDKARVKDNSAEGGATSVVYEPLFNANNSGTELMNDFLFWGQSLQSSPASYPDNIASHQISYMKNRVFRTMGYYGKTTPDAYYYNAYLNGTSSMTTFVHIPATTTIDFTCKNDRPAATGMDNGNIFYPPMNDNATTFSDFSIKTDANVTQNLLVYTADNDDANDTEAYDVVDNTLRYDETTKESLINGHHIVDGTSGFSTSLLHLVERTPDNENSDGETCYNNNLCVPIPFDVTNRAWYIRKPAYYAEDNTGAWEGICLPFSADKAEAYINGEITHFYGSPSDDELNDPKQNIHTLHHEYWLRGLVAVGQEGNATAATFQRPGAKVNNLFSPVDNNGNALTEGVSYIFANTFFADTYGDRFYNKDANPYYAVTSHTYPDYLRLTAGVPYIVRFPGERYYEFDLSSTFYNRELGKSEAPQTVTFNAYGKGSKGTSYGNITIPVTASMSTTVDGFSHYGIFTATGVAEGSIYGMNNSGNAFDDASAISTIMPFRTYMAPVVSGAKTHKEAPSVINIAEPTGIDKIKPEAGGDDDDDQASEDHISVRPISDRRVRIESTVTTTMNVYTTTGQLYRTLDIQPGTAVYSGFQQGAYLFGKTKVMIGK